MSNRKHMSVQDFKNLRIENAEKIDNMKLLYQQIPRCSRWLWFYPEGKKLRMSLILTSEQELLIRRRKLMVLGIKIMVE